MNKGIVDRLVPDKYDPSKHEFADWFSQIEVCFNLAGWPENQARHLLRTLLPQSGDDKIKAATDEEANTLENLRKILAPLYENPRAADAAHRRLVGINREKEENIQEYAARVSALTKKAHPQMPINCRETEMIRHFNSGLTRELRAVLNILQITGWEELVKQAANQDVLLEQEAADAVCEASPETDKNLLEDIKNTLEELKAWKNGKTSSRTEERTGGKPNHAKRNATKKGGKCFHCGIIGHFQAECRKKKKEQHSGNANE